MGLSKPNFSVYIFLIVSIARLPPRVPKVEGDSVPKDVPDPIPPAKRATIISTGDEGNMRGIKNKRFSEKKNVTTKSSIFLHRKMKNGLIIFLVIVTPGIFKEADYIKFSAQGGGRGNLRFICLLI